MSKKNPFADLDALRAQGDADVQEFQRHEQELPELLPEKRRREQFVKVPIEVAGKIARVAHEPWTFIWLWPVYLSWKTGSRTVSLSNIELRKWGIARDTKRRALAAYERAGLLKVERHRGRSVRVTLLH